MRSALSAVVLVAAASPALAQYKCVDPKGRISYSEQPCAAGSKQGTLSAPAMGAAAPPAQAAPRPDPAALKIVYYDVQGVDPASVWAWMKAHGPKGYSAYTQCNVTYQYRSRSQGGQCVVTGLETKLDITMTMPRWNPPAGADPALAARWSSFLVALRLHEDGHADRGYRFEAEVKKALSAVSAPCAELASALRREFDRLNAASQASNDAYDRETDHGTKQGATF